MISAIDDRSASNEETHSTNQPIFELKLGDIAMWLQHVETVMHGWRLALDRHRSPQPSRSGLLPRFYYYSSACPRWTRAPVPGYLRLDSVPDKDQPEKEDERQSQLCGAATVSSILGHRTRIW